MINFKALLADYPPVIQYVVVIGFILVLIYLALILTRFLGSKMGGEKIYFDDPEAYDKTIPDLFGSRSRKRKAKQKNPDKAKSEPSKETENKDSEKTE